MIQIKRPLSIRNFKIVRLIKLSMLMMIFGILI